MSRSTRSERGWIGLIEMGKQCTPWLQEKELATLIHLFDWRMMSGPSMCVTLVCIDSQTPLYRHNSRRIWQLFLSYEQESYNPSQWRRLKKEVSNHSHYDTWAFVSCWREVSTSCAFVYVAKGFTWLSYLEMPSGLPKCSLYDTQLYHCTIFIVLITNRRGAESPRLKRECMYTSSEWKWSLHQEWLATLLRFLSSQMSRSTRSGNGGLGLSYWESNAHLDCKKRKWPHSSTCLIGEWWVAP